MSVQITSTTVPANDNLADFKSWASVISAWMATAGWVQANDTGQVVWTATVFTLTQATVSGGNGIYSFSSYTGPVPRIGMSVIITGFTNGGNNLTATITALTGTTSGTFTVVNGGAVNETHAGSATTTAQAAAPSTSTSVYEIWQSTDALSSTLPIFLKFEYGTSGTASCITFAATAATGSNGSGTLTGSVSNRTLHTTTVNSTTAAESDFSGSTGRIAMIMFRTNTGGSVAFFFAIERAHDATGADTDAYFVLYFASGTSGTRAAAMQIVQRPALGSVLPAETEFVSALTTGSSGIVGTSVALGPCFPVIGKLDNPTMACAFAKGADIVEGATVSIAFYGGSHTYLCTKGAGNFGSLPRNAGTTNGLLMRWE
jgi:hypothetical protein